MDTESLANQLEQAMKAARMGDARLASLVNDTVGNPQFLHRSTIRNWRTGISKSVKDWRQLTAIAAVLHLDETATNHLLKSGNCPSLKVLRSITVEDDKQFLAQWKEQLAPVQQPEIVPAQQFEERFNNDKIEKAEKPGGIGRIRSKWGWGAVAAGMLPIFLLGLFLFGRWGDGGEALTAADLRAHWSFEEGSGTTLRDITGNTPDGLLQNGVTWVDTPDGRILQFDGVDDVVSIQNDPVFNQAPFTISVWFRLDALPSERNENGIIVRKKHTEAPWGSWDINVPDTDRIYFNVYAADNSQPTRVQSDQTAVTGVWYHAVGVLDENYGMQLYINGVRQSQTAHAEGLFESAGALHFGAGSATGVRLHGAIRDVRLYATGLTTEQITEIK